MNKRVDILIEAARKLTPEEQAELLERLPIEIEADPAEGSADEVAAAWVTEAKDRAGQIDRNEVELVPWEEVLSELRK